MATNGLAPAGSSTYTSDTLHVGDGTWDSSRDDFLLPNLMGLNFATMRYNGMGNRFSTQIEYHQLIKAHGILAVMTFLFMIPFAIFIARFYRRNPRLALRLHIWTHILVFFFATVVFVLGWFAVGPRRSLTNPHHGIGLAIYVMIIFQVLYGSWVHHHEKSKFRHRLPLRLFLHQWLGRAIALLGIAQVALGLTLYGSPKVCFVLYAVWGFMLLLLYFILSYRQRLVIAIDDRGSYYSESRTDATPERPPKEHHHGKLKTAAAAVGGAGLLAAFSRRRNRSRSRSRSHSRIRTNEHSSHHDGSSYTEEKYSEEGGREDHTWRNRFLGGAAGLGGIALLRNMFKGRRNEEDESEISDYSRRPHHVLGGSHSITETDVSRVEEGRVPTTPTRPRPGGAVPATAAAVAGAAALSDAPSRPHRTGNRVSGGSIYSFSESNDSWEDSPGKAKRHTHNVRTGIAALGLAGYLRHKWGERKDRRDDRRAEEILEREREEERLARQNSARRRYTGDGAPRPTRRHGSYTESELTPLGGSNPELALGGIPRPSGGHTSINQTRVDETAANTAANSGPSHFAPPPVLPVHGQRISSSESEAYTSTVGGGGGGGHHNRRRREEEAIAAGVGAAAAGAALEEHKHRRDTSSHGGRYSSEDTSAHSPRASVQVKMHNDGRHVTLRRLDPKERAARRRRESLSSAGGNDAPDAERWRRVERREAEQAAQMRADAIAAGEAQHNIPPTPPYPLSAGYYPPQPLPQAQAQASSSIRPIVPSGPSQSHQSLSGPAIYSTQPLAAQHPSQPPISYHGNMSPALSDLPPPPPIPASGGSNMAGSPGSAYGSGPSNVDSRAESNRRRRRAERARAEAAAKAGSGQRVGFT